eukprot:jgi/Antlo1/1618/1830
MIKTNTEMIIPPPINTKERESHDISGLRVLYLLCEDIGIAQEEHVQRAFLLLRKLVGKDRFLKEFITLQDYIETQRANKYKEERRYLEKKEQMFIETARIAFENA